MKNTQGTKLFGKRQKESGALKHPSSSVDCEPSRKRGAFLILMSFLVLPLASCNTGNHTVNFYVDGDLVATLTGVKDGAKISPPSETLYEGYTVKSWFVKEEGLESPWSFSGSVVGSDLDLYANFEKNTYLVTFVDREHGKTQFQEKVTYRTEYDFSSVFLDPFYSVESWTDPNGGRFPLNGEWTLAQDLTLTANWSLKVFNITYALPDGVENDPSNPQSFSYNTPSFTLRPAKKEGYVFQYWYDSRNTKISVIDNSIHRDLILHPKFESEKYTLTFIDKKNGHETVSRTIEYGTSYDFSDVFEDQHYSITGWYDDDLNYYPNVGRYNFLHGGNLHPVWEEIRYKITYNLAGGVNDERNPDSYTISDCPMELFNPKRDCFGFQCWVDGDGNRISSLDKNTHGDLALTAVWSDLRDIYLSSSDETKGGVEIVKGERQNGSGSEVTVKANPKAGYAFEGWYHQGTCVSTANPHTFLMPSANYDLQAKFVETDVHLGIKPSFDSTGTTLTYGLYPQAHVQEASLIERLNSLSATEGNGWYLLDGDYYTKRRTHDGSLKFEDGAKIETGVDHWFKCEPIQWGILSSSGGEYSLISTKVLDTHCFNEKRNLDYYESDIRTWLNTDFYNSAFYFDASIIQTHNTSYSCWEYGTSPEAYDEVYLQRDASGSVFATATATDWARIGEILVDRDGTSSSWWSVSSKDLFDKREGVRPAITVKID